MKTPDEIKKGLECCQTDESKSCKPCPYVSCVTCISDLNRDTLAYTQQLEAAQPKWISVEERLPELFTDVLILVKETEFYGCYKEFSKSYLCQYVAQYDDEWFTVYCHGHKYIRDTADEPNADKLEVTHWMPLPEPPKEETC